MYFVSGIDYKRTEEEKRDPFLSWKRTDISFFASGACHILAYLFIELHPKEDYKLIYIKPAEGFSGSHLYVSNGIFAFDFNGWTPEKVLLEETQIAYERIYPGWNFERKIITDSIEDFCQNNFHRLPYQFANLPWERAYNYINRFPSSPFQRN